MRVVTLCGCAWLDVCIVPRRRTIDFLIFPKGVKTSNMKNIIKGKNTEVQIPALPLSNCVMLGKLPAHLHLIFLIGETGIRESPLHRVVESINQVKSCQVFSKVPLHTASPEIVAIMIYTTIIIIPLNIKEKASHSFSHLGVGGGCEGESSRVWPVGLGYRARGR